MSRFEKSVIFFVFLFIVLGISFSRTDLAYFEGVYAREDGFIEWLTVLALLYGSVMTVYRVYELRKERHWIFLGCLAILSILFFFGAGEEISWGQRIFQVKSPEFFMQHNSQMETNVHNLILNGVKLNRLIFGTLLGIVIGLYFLILPILYRKIEKVKTFANSLALPIPRWSHIICYLIVAVLVSLIHSPKRGELIEFGGCWIFLLMAYNPLNQEIYKAHYN